MNMKTPNWNLNISLEAMMKLVFILVMDLEGIINNYITSEKLKKGKEILEN